MKRNWDLIRAILTAAEAKDPGQMLFDSEIADHDIRLVRGHISMLHDAGYLKAKMVRGTSEIISAIVLEVSLQGYDLLDTVRSKPLWEKIKTLATQKGLELSFDVVKKLGTSAIEQLLSGG